MANWLRKTQVALAVLSIGTGSVFADWVPPSSQVPNYCCERGDIFLFGDLIVWRATGCGLDTCVSQNFSHRVFDGSMSSRFNGRDQDPDFRWSPGFRVGGGYAFAASNWDLEASWTRFHSHAHGSHQHHWHIHFDGIDATAGYDSEFSGCFGLRPFFGVRGVRIKQYLNTEDSGFFADEASFSGQYNREKFGGAGPLVGFEADLTVGGGFSFYTDASAGWLYGHFDTDLSGSERFMGATDSWSVCRDVDATLPVADVGLGIRWQTKFCNRMMLMLEAGLEEHRYFDYNHFCGCNDLNFDGFNFGIGLAF